MTVEQYVAGGFQAVDYYQMSQWQRFRDFTRSRRHMGISLIPLMVLTLTLHPRYWLLGFESWQCDYRFHVGPFSLIWPYE